MWELPLEHFKLFKCPIIAPISENQIVFLNFGCVDGYVATYNVETRTVVTKGKIKKTKSMISCKYDHCKMIRNGQVAAAVYYHSPGRPVEKVVVTYTKDDSKIRIHREDKGDRNNG